MKHKLPTPACNFGYPRAQLRDELGSRFREFERWVHGHSVVLCTLDADDSPDSSRHLCGEAHGVVIPVRDLELFLARP